MTLSTTQLIAFRNSASPMLSAEAVMNWLIIESLEPQLKNIIRYMLINAHTSITTSDIVTRFEIDTHTASTGLGDLRKLGLITSIKGPFGNQWSLDPRLARVRDIYFHEVE